MSKLAKKANTKFLKSYEIDDMENVSFIKKQKRKPATAGISNLQLKEIHPLTENQKKVFEAFVDDKNIVCAGSAGTGKSFLLFYLCLQELIYSQEYDKIIVFRSSVPTRNIGFLPGDHEDKSSLYQIPYKNMVKYMFALPTEADFEMLYGNLKTQGTISFWSTSFIRGTTLDKSIIIVDEFQNLNYHELDSIITRVGEDSKIMFCGDATQSDLIKTNEIGRAHV